MAEKKTIDRARQDAEEGKSPSTQAGEFVREEIEHVREGRHGARSAKQAVAIGLSKARRAGVPLPPPKKGTVSEKTRKNAERDYEKGQAHEPISTKRSKARREALKREPDKAATHRALSRQSSGSAAQRPKQRSVASRKASAKRTRKGTATDRAGKE